MAKLRNFFNDYADALTNAKTARVSKAFAEDFMAISPDFRASMKNDEQFRAQITRAATFYKGLGVDVVEVKNYLEAELGTGYWLTKIEWELLDEDLNTIITFDNTYLVEKNENGAAIVLVIAHNEQERMREAGLLPDES